MPQRELSGTHDVGAGVHAGPSSADSGYSPDISMELEVAGQHFSVASLDSDEIIVRDPRKVDAGPATIRLQVADRLTIFHIELPNGIDPALSDQPYILRECIEQAAA